MRSEYRANRGNAARPVSHRAVGLRAALLIGLCAAAFPCGDVAGQKKKPVVKGNAKAKAKIENLITPAAFPKLWKHVSSDRKATLKDTWSLDETTKIPELVCTGKPPGYLRTVEEFTNFDLSLEWLYPKDENCNSGILVYCGADKVWPASIQVQLHRPFVGSIFPSPGATSAATVTVKDLKLKIGVWHKCRVQSVKGTLTVWINEKQVGAVANCKPKSGSIGLQSEGFPIRFRRFEIQRLDEKGKAIPKAKPASKKKVPSPKVAPKTAADGGGRRRMMRCSPQAEPKLAASATGAFACKSADVLIRRDDEFRDESTRTSFHSYGL